MTDARYFATPENAELVDSLENHYKPYQYSTLYSLYLPNLSGGEIVQAHCQFEVTNDLETNVMLAHAMLLHRSETVIKNSEKKPSGSLLCPYAGENVTPGMHHGFRTLVGSCQVEGAGDAWISVIAYCATNGTAKGRKVKVEKNYGGLSAIAFR